MGGLIFDALVKKDEHYNLVPWLATSWEQPDALTWVFHLRDGVRFQDGRPLEAEDVVWTIESLIDPKLGLISAKSGNFGSVDQVEARDRLTVVVHMKRPDAGLLFNMSDGLFGVVPRGAGSDFGLHPVGSGPFRFVSQVQDKEVVLERWAWMLEQRTAVNGNGIRMIQADSVQRGAGHDYERAGVAEGIGGCGQQCADPGYGVCAARCAGTGDGERGRGRMSGI